MKQIDITLIVDEIALPSLKENLLRLAMNPNLQLIIIEEKEVEGA